MTLRTGHVLGRFTVVSLLAQGGVGAAALAGCKSAPDPASVAPPVASVAPAPEAPVFASHDPLRPSVVAFRSGPNELHGFLYRPAGNGPFPAIVFNHGSERLPGPMTGQAEFYVNHGFVLFVPHRRGHGRSSDVGRYIEDVLREKSDDPQVFVDELVAQLDDVMAAIAYVGSLPGVDPKRIAVSGCSLGGIESLLAAERGAGIVAAIDFAGASVTWASNAALQERMKRAARNAKVPVFFLQAENDYDTAPSKVLSEEMRLAGKPARVHVFPPRGSTPDEGHGFCRGGERPPWGEEVLAFLKEAMTPR